MLNVKIKVWLIPNTMDSLQHSLYYFLMLLFILSIFGLLSVAIGAFAAHILEALLTEVQLNTLSTAVNYHQLYAILLVLLELFRHCSLTKNLVTRSLILSFLIAVSVFSGSLYFYLLTGIKFFVFITPLGGFGLMLSWGYLGYRALSCKRL
ncbi:MAG: DUF423 domain-containing protein [bacterium]